MTVTGATGMAGPDQIRVLIVDDHPVVRRGLRAMLQDEAWVADIAEAESVAGSVREAITQRSQVVAMDLVLPDGDGIDATKRILQAVPDAKVLMLTLTDDEETVTRALCAGARGYLLKDTDPDTVVDALRTVASGGTVLGPRVTVELTAAGQRAAPLAPPFDQLTDREREVLVQLRAAVRTLERWLVQDAALYKRPR
jgi:two-component system, NarL family, nitrate/nitrite response regulator NarL